MHRFNWSQWPEVKRRRGDRGGGRGFLTEQRLEMITWLRIKPVNLPDCVNFVKGLGVVESVIRRGD